ncbi:hypothetical protein H072_22 [Dactylellina haptotyla CBS 200.50]|uniref:WSC domain-containing protein n=1 Tax=Dactylellina haptotyla (strain CBS 200.50) TaxID=1284197 RepID=S8C2Q6_DACHA|nr:hypothetical protein H072_22 [Dactylellina haptotyla CBS 200.50]
MVSKLSFGVTLALTSLTIAAPGQSVSKRATDPNWPQCDKSFKAWTYDGCYAEAGVGSAFHWDSGLPSDQVTKSSCIAICKGSNFRYAGIKGADGQKTCRCTSFIETDKFVSDKGCSVPCKNGDQGGGLWSYSVFKDPTFSTFDGKTSADGYQYIGCFPDDEKRIMQYSPSMGTGGWTDMTLEKCFAACAAKGYAYAGMQYSLQCFCGGKIRADIIKGGQKPLICNMLCQGTTELKAGDRQICGGSWAMSCYYNPDLDTKQRCGEEAPPESKKEPSVKANDIKTPAAASLAKATTAPPPTAVDLQTAKATSTNK